MDVPFAIHVDSAGLETLPPDQARLELKARSLRNTLLILRRRLKQLRKDSAHTLEDVEHYKYVLDHLDQRWRDADGFASALRATDPGLADTCSHLWTQCFDLATDMEREAQEMPPEVRAVHDRLADLHHRLKEALEREHGREVVAQLGAELDEIDASRREHGGVFWGDVEAPAPGQAICSELLSHNYELLRECASSASDTPAVLRAVEDRLRGMMNELRRLAGQKHHTSDDVRHYSFLLGAIASAEAEYEGEWQGSEAKRLLEQCLELVEELEASAEDMPPEVAEVHSQLQLLHKELHAMAATSKPPDAAQLAAARRALDAIDNERAAHGGVFGGGGGGGERNAPPGQAACARLLSECFELVHGLQERAAATHD